MAYTTNQSLLAALKRGDGVSWQEFYETYRPLILFCGAPKLNPDELEDLVQNVMLKVFNAQKTFVYDPAKGRLRDWLGKIIRNETINILRKRPTAQSQESSTLLYSENFEDLWQQEWEKHLFQQALEEMKKRVSEYTFQAFDLYVLQDMPPAVVAKALDLKITQVYKAKLRCTLILQQIVRELRQND